MRDQESMAVGTIAGGGGDDVSTLARLSTAQRLAALWRRLGVLAELSPAGRRDLIAEASAKHIAGTGE